LFSIPRSLKALAMPPSKSKGVVMSSTPVPDKYRDAGQWNFAETQARRILIGLESGPSRALNDWNSYRNSPLVLLMNLPAFCNYIVNSHRPSIARPCHYGKIPPEKPGKPESEGKIECFGCHLYDLYLLFWPHNGDLFDESGDRKKTEKQEKDSLKLKVLDLRRDLNLLPRAIRCIAQVNSWYLPKAYSCHEL
jgi:hypothetical protein